MKKTALFSILITSSLLFNGCNNANQKESLSESTANDTVSAGTLSSSAAIVNPKDSVHKFIRTADIKFRVKDVVKATYAIESITSRLGGFVTSTNLTSSVSNTTTVTISADSSLETTYYTVTNSMNIRIPSANLDSGLRVIGTLVDFMDYRIIKADDVALQILSNKMTQSRVARNEQRLTKAIDNRGRKLNETTTAEELLLSKQEEADNSKISNLSLRDQINYSTVVLNIYQRPSIRRELIPNEKNIDAFTPGFGTRLVEGLQTGWHILEEIILFFFRLWALILLGIAAFIIYRRIKKQSDKNSNGPNESL